MHPTSRTRVLLTSWALLISVSCAGAARKASAGNAGPTTGGLDLKSGGDVVREWVILGPFPNPQPEKGRGAPGAGRGSFDHDYLKTLGGEAKAQLKPGMLVSATDPMGTATIATARASSLTTSTAIDFFDYYADNQQKLAYAACTVVSPRAQKAWFFLGSDDGAKVWVNGKPAWEAYTPEGRGCVPRSDCFEVALRPGVNHVLVKVENNLGGWGAMLEVFDEKKGGEIVREIRARENRLAFLREGELMLTSPGGVGYLFAAGEPDRVVWQDPAIVRRLEGDIPLKVRWFDKDLDEVTSPTKMGLCSAYVEGKLRGGVPLRRAIGAVCSPRELGRSLYAPEQSSLWTSVQGRVAYPGKPFDPQVWSEKADLTDKWVGRLFHESLSRSPRGALLINALLETKPGDKQPYGANLPLVLGDDLHLAVKLKAQGLTGKTRPLPPPRKLAGPAAPVLRKGTPEEAGVKPGTKERIDAVCAKWAAETTEPFAILVARHGVIITHEAFGRNPDGTSATLEMKASVASITKAISGLLFARFVDQKLAAIDDPLGKWLPDYETTGPKAITFRHCFTHTTGLTGHGEWGGLHNPHLENVVLNLLPFLHPGEALLYNGMGYDLAGRAMEVITGKSILRLFEEGLYAPLGISGVSMDDMAYGAELSAHELGVIGQTLCNRGSYGDTEIVSRETFDKLMPRKLVPFFPNIDNKELEWGIGLVWMRAPKPGVRPDSRDPKDYVLSMNTIGHGSATNCILRVDLDNDLVVVQVRPRGGAKYDENLGKFLASIAEGL